MQLAVDIIERVLGVAMILTFAAVWIASYKLSPYDERIEHERQEPSGFRIWPKRWPPVTENDYPEEVRSLWVFRDRCGKSLGVCVGLLVVLAVVATVADVRMFWDK